MPATLDRVVFVKSPLRPEIKALVLGLTAGLIGIPLLGWGYFLTQMVHDGHTDFRATYTAGYMLRKGEPIYDPDAQFEEQNRLVSREQAFPDPFNHPAYEALIYVPLSLFSFVRAYWLWFLANVAMLAAVYRLLRSELSALATVAPWLPAASLLAYIPFGVTLMQGQDSILLALLFATSFAWMRKDKTILAAGAILGLGVFRFQVLIPIAACFLLWRRWKLLAGFACVAFPAAVLSIALGGFWPYVRLLIDFRKRGGAAEQIVSSMPNLRGLILSSGGSTAAVLIVSVALFCLALRFGWQRDIRYQFAVAITFASLVSYHGLLHDLSMLFIPCAFLLGTLELAALAALAIVFITPSILLTFAPHHVYLSAVGPLSLVAYLRPTEKRLRSG